MKVELEVDVDKYRWSLVGDGYLYDEAKRMSDDEVINVLQRRLTKHIEREYGKSLDVIRVDLMFKRA